MQQQNYRKKLSRLQSKFSKLQTQAEESRLAADQNRHAIAMEALQQLGEAHRRTCSLIESLPLLCRGSRRMLIVELEELTCCISGHLEDATHTLHNQTNE